MNAPHLPLVDFSRFCCLAAALAATASALLALDAARYDLVLIAPQILGATKPRASLGGEATGAGEGLQQWFKGRAGRVVLWGVPGGVVVLLVVVARLLPKPESHR